MDISLKLPRWMVDKIVWILERCSYTGAGEIIRRIVEQMEDNK